MSQNVLRKQARLDPIPFDPATGKEIPFVSVRVDVRTLGLVACGVAFELGEQTVMVRECDLPGLRALVETASAGELALVDGDLAWHQAQCAGGANPRSHEPDFGASFAVMLKRAPKPLARLEILNPGPEKNRKAA